MIKFQDLRQGDYILAEFDGSKEHVEVTQFNYDEKEICVDNGVQEFWFKEDELYPLILNEEQLLKLNFQKQVHDDGSVKYLKGAFRIQLTKDGDFSDFEMWYREDRRHIKQPIAVHELQNHYYQMTKVELNED